MSEEQKPDTAEQTAAALYRYETQGGDWELLEDKAPWRIRASFAIAAHNEELARHPVEVSLSELESAIAIARKREGKHAMDPASEVTEFFVDLGLPIEVIE